MFRGVRAIHNAVLETQQKLARILQQKPELQQLVLELKGILEQEGLDLQGQTMPSKLQLLRLFMKPEVRDAATKLTAAFQEAGINPQEMMGQMMAMQKFFGDLKK
ncbi:uncharacterized protein FIBRA_01190 [Fibroporia radiculosa]|uniref:Uncharacterized protein n=1 Tax=Fibroporia radiculosa TaxID=599839 RepID=J4GJI9_9APHY|nr:uncharacterized protein FIBRA_01190 [Fibroporia radiculosa]CCL99175.1 predicted protein [Fibroporia radiculosa]